MKFSLSKKKDSFGLSDGLIFGYCSNCGSAMCTGGCYDYDD